MQFQVEWLDPLHTSLGVQLEGPWRWDRFDRAVWQAFNVVKEHRFGVVLVLDMLAVTDVPNAAIAQIEATISKAPDNKLKTVIVSRNERLLWHFTLARHPHIAIIKQSEDALIV